jgi:DNA-binding MarR family transcriptional regulator
MSVMDPAQASPHRPQRRRALEAQALIEARALVDHMRTLYRELERRTGAPIAVHRVLHLVESEPGITASRLAAQLGIKRPNLSHLLRLMAGNGWIRRHRADHDQRSVCLYVTPAGRDMIGATHGRVAGVLQRAIQGLTLGDLRRLQPALRALVRRLPPLGPVAVRASRGARPRAGKSATRWRARTDSNRRPPGSKPGALSN